MCTVQGSVGILLPAKGTAFDLDSENGRKRQTPLDVRSGYYMQQIHDVDNFILSCV